MRAVAGCDCGRIWRGHASAHCPTCHNHFTSDRAFDAHLASPDSPNPCYPPETLIRKDGEPRFLLVQRAHGPVWMLNKPRVQLQEVPAWVAAKVKATDKAKSAARGCSDSPIPAQNDLFPQSNTPSASGRDGVAQEKTA